MPPFPGNPGNPRVNSRKLYLAVFYNEFDTFARKMKLILGNGVMKCFYGPQIPENVKK